MPSNVTRLLFPACRVHLILQSYPCSADSRISKTLASRQFESSNFPRQQHQLTTTMSLRRKSCNSCFKGRRKCNLAYPICGTCQKTKKTCQYAYPPSSPPRSDSHSTASDSSIAQLAIHDDALESLMSVINDSTMGYLATGDISDLFEPSPQFPDPGSASSLMIPEPPPSLLESIGRFVGSLGEVQPIQGSTQSWQWVIDELKHFLPELAQQGQTIFIHRELYRNSVPQAIRTALGVSSMSCMLSDANRDMLFRIIDAEVLELLRPRSPTTLLDDLAGVGDLSNDPILPWRHHSANSG